MNKIKHHLVMASVITIALANLSTLAKAQESAAKDDMLLGQFISPPDATKPRCFWYWYCGQYSKEGITKDLEAMRRAGIGQAYISTLFGTRAGGVPYFSDEWWGCIEHAIREGSRIGVDIGLFLCPGGWCCACGPWVKAEQTMRYMGVDEIKVQGPGVVLLKFPKPKANSTPILFQAFPAPACDDDDIMKHSPKVSGDAKNGIVYEVAQPFTARSVGVVPVKEAKKNEAECELEASDDGQTYRPVCRFPFRRLTRIFGFLPEAPVMVSFPATTARFFRLKCIDTSREKRGEPCNVGSIALSAAARVGYYAEQQLGEGCFESSPTFLEYTWPNSPEPERPELAVNEKSVLTIQPKTNPDGSSSWEAPPGRWVVQRIMAVPTGKARNITGWEVDKLHPAAIRDHMAAYVGRLYDRLSPDERRSLKTIIIDSWEVQFQNWTDDLLSSFQTSSGYDPHPYLPVLSGRVVGSADRSSRFLWDLRRVVADRFVRDGVGTFREEAHRRGMKLWVENYGHCPTESLAYGGAADEVAGEFWGHPAAYDSCANVWASSAHIYGRKEVFAEAFTCGPAFGYSPASLKSLGDLEYCQGINQFVLHLYEHQPNERRPGVWSFGSDFNRHNTWFAHAQPWTDYLRRCTVMLQAGIPVSDVAYYITEDVPKTNGPRPPAFPAGYKFDWINADVILNRLSVKDGRFVLPDGASYKLLVLPPSQTMRPAVLKKIGELVKAGGAVVAPEAPSRSPSMQDYPACDQTVRTLAKEIWDSGKIISDTNPTAVLAKLNTPPDVVAPKRINWEHRRAGEREIYFISNQTGKSTQAKVTFRVSGLAAELWHPVTTQRRPLPQLTATADGRTEIELEFDPNESYFVVFGKQWAVGSGQLAAKNFPQYKPLQEITGPWEVQFDSKWFYPDTGAGGKVKFDKLEDWMQRAEPAIKYYSGTAVYRKSFEYTAPATGSAPLFLDLGEVKDLARVKLNGQDLGCTWTAPYRLALGAALKNGTNTLEIEVVNRWTNRLVGDDLLPAEQRRTSVTVTSRYYGKDLQPAGLLGPVRVMAEQ